MADKNGSPGSVGSVEQPVAEKSTSVLLPDLTKETWEYLELKLWASFSTKIWILVTALVTVLGLLAALGMNTFIQAKVDTALLMNKEKMDQYAKSFESRGDSSLAMQAIYFHLSARLRSDEDKYIKYAANLKNLLSDDKYKNLRDSPAIKKLVASSDRYGDFETLSAREAEDLNSLDKDSSRAHNTSDDPLQMVKELALWNRHIIALRETIRSTEKLAFSTTQYDPDKLAQLYDKTIYPYYIASMKNSGAISIWFTSGKDNISALNPDARGELGFYIPNPIDEIFEPTKHQTP